MKPNNASPKERRQRRQVEILWALIAFMLVFAFSQVPLWIVANNAQAQKADRKEKRQEVADTPTAPAVTVHFAVRPDGQLFVDGKAVGERGIRQLFAKKKNIAVELALSSRELVTVFQECAGQGLAPTVKLAAKHP